MNAFCANSEPNRSSAPRFLHHPRLKFVSLFRDLQFDLRTSHQNFGLRTSNSVLGDTLHLSVPPCLVFLFGAFSRYLFIGGWGAALLWTRPMSPTSLFKSYFVLVAPSLCQENTLRRRKNTLKHTKTHYFLNGGRGCVALCLSFVHSRSSVFRGSPACISLRRTSLCARHLRKYLKTHFSHSPL